MEQEPLFPTLPHTTNLQSNDPSEALAEIRGLLYMPPSTDVWLAIWDCLQQVPDDLLCDTYIPYIHEHLGAWPDGLRLAPKKIKPLYYDKTKQPTAREEALLGLVDTLTIPPQQVLHNMHLPCLANNPLAHSLTSLDYYYNGCSKESWAAFAGATQFTQLRNLTFRNITMLSSQYELLASSPWLPQLQTLTLLNSHLDTSQHSCGVALPALQRLTLRDSNVDALLKDCFGKHPPQLTHLTIRETAPSAPALRLITTGCSGSLQEVLGKDLAYEEHDLLTALAEGGPYPQLTSLRLDQLRNTESQLHALLCGEHLPALETLEMSRLALGETLVDLLEEATSLTKLKSLRILYNELGDEGLSRLARLPHLASLETLTLQGVAPSAEGLEVLCREATFSQLKRLDLCSNDITQKRGKPLVEPHTLQALEHIDISYNAMGDALILGIVANPSTPSLVSFGCKSTGMSLPGLYALLSTTSVHQALRQGVLDKMLARCNREELTALLRLFHVPDAHKMKKPTLVAAARACLTTAETLERFLCHEMHIKQLSQQGMKATLRNMGEKGYTRLRAHELRSRVKDTVRDKDVFRDATAHSARLLETKE